MDRRNFLKGSLAALMAMNSGRTPELLAVPRETQTDELTRKATTIRLGGGGCAQYSCWDGKRYYPPGILKTKVEIPRGSRVVSVLWSGELEVKDIKVFEEVDLKPVGTTEEALKVVEVNCKLGETARHGQEVEFVLYYR